MDKSGGSLSGSGARIRRSRPPRRTGSNGSGDDLDKSEDFTSLVRKERPKRTLSGELESSLVIGDKNWKNLDTVHKNKFDFDDSDLSLMEDSFAGSSFASTADNSCADADDCTRRFIQVDEEPVPQPSSPGNPVSARKAPPRRTYSKQSKRMPKKVDPLSAISEDDNSDAED